MFLLRDHKMINIIRTNLFNPILILIEKVSIVNRLYVAWSIIRFSQLLSMILIIFSNSLIRPKIKSRLKDSKDYSILLRYLQSDVIKKT